MVVLVPLLVLLAGCTGPLASDLSASDLETEFDETTPPAEVSATVEIREEIDGDVRERTEAVWLRDDGAVRTDPVSDSNGDPGTLTVSDGETRWHHDRATGSTTAIEVDPDASSWLDGLYGQQERYLAAYDLTEATETTVENRDSYHLTFEPPANETVDQSVAILVGETAYELPLSTSEEPSELGVDRVEVWLDQETLFPVKHQISGDDLLLETTYTDLTIDSEFDDDLFEFTPPAANGGEGETKSEGETEPSPPDDENDTDFLPLPTIEDHESIADAEETVPFAVAEPRPSTLPDRVVFDGVTSYEFPDEDRTQVSVFYRGGGDGTITVTTSDGPREFATNGHDVPVGDATGSLEQTPQGTELQWTCGEQYYSVYVDTQFGDDTALEIGQQLGCR
ncbi:hypothetical protein C500_08512 [Natrialba magadii ATCC 43099]|uniref:LppX domain protein n=1 Tax=Natrialba magadii (strain ATCC 43099 / DSM 3394 / CCM 3739 / CIP 104546 / IAM 13178 / JCM 8861 / NBRC 102185 / NCIMB 2190 / MS3) TaxID=547559 RepID=L9V054_NATMM|nr:hypothetical protein C500_08512 [Natrialba magadii ATCC 43099]